MLPDLEIGIRLLVATVLSGVVGLERERGERAAGLRTHALVGLGACLVMIVSAFGFEDWHYSPGTLDPSRIAAQVVSGIGFLGAGVIIFQRDGGVVRGLTTAASVWVVAAIGLAVGGGMYITGVVATAPEAFVGLLENLQQLPGVNRITSAMATTNHTTASEAQNSTASK